MILRALVTCLSLCFSPCPDLTIFILIGHLVAITAFSPHNIYIFLFFLHFLHYSSCCVYYANICLFSTFPAKVRKSLPQYFISSHAIAYTLPVPIWSVHEKMYRVTWRAVCCRIMYSRGPTQIGILLWSQQYVTVTHTSNSKCISTEYSSLYYSRRQGEGIGPVTYWINLYK